MFLDFTRRNLDSVGTNRAPLVRDRNVCQQFAAIGYSFIPHNIPNVRATGLASLLEWHTLVMARAGADMYDVDLGLQSGICYADGMVLCTDECSLNVDNASTEPTPTLSTVAQVWPDSEVNMIISLHRSTVSAKSVILTPWLHRIDGLQNVGKPSSFTRRNAYGSRLFAVSLDASQCLVRVSAAPGKLHRPSTNRHNTRVWKS